MQPRQHFSHLPSSTVLNEALQIEAKRDVALSKQNVQYPKFDLFVSWMNEIQVDTHFFENPNDWQELINSGNQLRKLIAEKTIFEVQNRSTKLISVLESIEEYLGEETIIPKDIDVLFIFGSKDLGRVHKAVAEIYSKYAVKTILMTGGSRYDSQEKSEPEALVFRNEAIKLGVPREKIVIESESITIADNVRSGLNLLDSLQIKYENIVTMVSWFAQRRAWAHLKKYTDAEIYRVNSDPKSIELTPGKWYEYEIGVSTILSEFLKMKMAVMINTA